MVFEAMAKDDPELYRRVSAYLETEEAKDWRDRSVVRNSGENRRGKRKWPGKVQGQDIHAEVPTGKPPDSVGGAWTKREYMLFPGYVFLDMDFTARNYYRVKQVPGVIRILGDSMAPSTLSYLEAEWIRILSGSGRASGAYSCKGGQKWWYYCHQRSFGSS